MTKLRLQVDRIDEKLLKLFQQRNLLSAAIGETKRKHGLEVYAPHREESLLERLLSLNDPNRLPEVALHSIYREIISSSRAAQGQAPLGMIQDGSNQVEWTARNVLGGSDQYRSYRSWPSLFQALKTRAISLALVQGHHLAEALTKGRLPWPRPELEGSGSNRDAFTTQSLPSSLLPFWVTGEISCRQKSLRENRSLFIFSPNPQFEEDQRFSHLVLLIERKLSQSQLMSKKVSPETFSHLPPASAPQLLFRRLAQAEASRRFPQGWTLLKMTSHQPLAGSDFKQLLQQMGQTFPYRVHWAGAYLAAL